jgi:hypothetical protein
MQIPSGQIPSDDNVDAESGDPDGIVTALLTERGFHENLAEPGRY